MNIFKCKKKSEIGFEFLCFTSALFLRVPQNKTNFRNSFVIWKKSLLEKRPSANWLWLHTKLNLTECDKNVGKATFEILNKLLALQTTFHSSLSIFHIYVYTHFPSSVQVLSFHESLAKQFKRFNFFIDHFRRD